MFAGHGPSHRDSGGPSSQSSIADRDLDIFTNNLDLSVECQASLRSLDEDSRNRCLMILQSKMSQRSIQAPSQYLAGIIRNELKVGGFASQAWSVNHPRPLSIPDTPLAPTPALLQRVASPAHQRPPVRGVKRPAWVTDAWISSTRPSAFMKKMYSVIGSTAMSSLNALPSQTRFSVLLAVTFSEGAWVDPSAAVQGALNTINSFPALQNVAAARGGKPGRGIVAIQLGSSYGSEWVHLLKAMEKLKPEFPDLYLHSRHALLPGVAATDMYAAMFPQTTLHKDAQAFVEMLNQCRAEWRAVDALVLLMVTLPADSGNASGPSPYHGYHSGESCNIWKIIDVMKAVMPLADNRWALVCVDPKPLFDASPSLAQTCFGEGWEIPQAKTRVPCKPWRFRSWPAVAEQDLHVDRVDPSPEEEAFAADLRAMRAGLKPDVCLASMEELEQHNDSVNFNDGGAQAANSYELFAVKQKMADGSTGCATRLLNRGELAHLWGVRGWGIDEAFNRVHPCCGRCDAITGFACDKGMLGVACGAARYCIHCEGWYKMLLDSAPAHAHSLIFKVLHQSLLMAAPSGTQPGWMSVESHSCDDAGCSG